MTLMSSIKILVLGKDFLEVADFSFSGENIKNQKIEFNTAGSQEKVEQNRGSELNFKEEYKSSNATFPNEPKKLQLPTNKICLQIRFHLREE